MTSTRRGRAQAQVDAHGHIVGGSVPCGRPHINLKLESPVECKEVGVYFNQNFVVGRNKKTEIFRRYKLVIITTV